MKKWIRWKGLIPFVGVIGALLVFWYLFLDKIVERMIESAGTRIVGAKVEIDRTDVTLLPVGISIDRLQVTHPESPMINVVEIANMEAGIDGTALLRKKIIVETLSMDGVRFNTPRKTSGAVKAGSKKTTPKDSQRLKHLLEKAGCEGFELPSLKKLDFQKIMADENLQSLEVIMNFQTSLDTEKQKIHETLKTLPNEKTFNEYRKRIEALQGKKTSISGLLGTATEAVTLKKDIQTDVDRLNKEYKSFEKRVEAYKVQFSQLQKASKEDIRRIKNKYTLSAQGMANMSQLLIGSRLCEWWETGYAWYQRAKPYLHRAGPKPEEPETAAHPRGRGINVKFPERNPLPDFLIRLVRANMVLDAGDLTGVIENVTAEQRLVDKPMTFRFLGRQMKGLQSLNAQGEMNTILPDRAKYVMESNIKALEIKNFALSSAKALPVRIKDSRADIDFRFSLQGEDLSLKLNSGFRAVKMTADIGAGAGDLAQAVASTIDGVERFDVKVAVSGSVDDFSFKIQSDLDKILQSAVSNLVMKEAAKFTAELEKEVMTRISGPLAEAESRLKTFGPLGEEFTKRLDTGTALLKADVLKGVKLPL